MPTPAEVLKFIETARRLAMRQHGLGCVVFWPKRTVGCNSCELLNALDELEHKEVQNG